MMNVLWGGMLLVGIVYGILTGHVDKVTEAVLASAKEAVSLAIAIAGITAFWNGMMHVAWKAGMVQGLTRRMRPAMRFLFPAIPEEHPAMAYIATNMAANILGLGWAATPAGLKAMEALAKLEEERKETRKHSGENMYKNRKDTSGTASREMCIFLIINISSLQLIPVNIIAYRSQYGSVSPTAIVGPGIVATLVSTGVAVIFCKVMCARKAI